MHLMPYLVHMMTWFPLFGCVYKGLRMDSGIRSRKEIYGQIKLLH